MTDYTHEATAVGVPSNNVEPLPPPPENPGLPPDPPYDEPYIPGQRQPDDQPVRGASWQPVDLTPYLTGKIARPEPSIGLARTDGLHLLYPGLEHTIIGEMESGKSWFCAACVAAELNAGHHCVYIHYEEADPTDTIERLRILGVPDHTILTHFRFVTPNEPVDPHTLAALLDPAPHLVLHDGVNEAMALHRMEIRDENGAAQFRQRLIKPCTATGAAVLSCDHVVKDKERRGRDALGSIHKGNGLTGALILLENAQPFGRGQRGASHVHITKDRPGYLRRHGHHDPRTPGKTYIGTLIVDDTRTHTDQLDLTFTTPIPRPEEADALTNQQRDDNHLLETIRRLEKDGTTPTLRNIRATATGIGKDRADDALTRLVLDGNLTEIRGPRNARIFTTRPTATPLFET